MGSVSEMKEMLQCCDKNQVRPMVEVLPMSEVNEDIQKVREGETKIGVELQS